MTGRVPAATAGRVAVAPVPNPCVRLLTVAVTDEGVVEVAFRAPGRVVASLRDRWEIVDDLPLLGRAVAELGEYFDGRRRHFDVPVDWRLTAGTQRDVLRVLYDTVPYGTVTTYGELAAACGIPDGAQAVGTVMGSNPVPVIVPCHRVVAAGNALGGYGGGRETKRRLLTLEGVLQPALF